VTGSLEQIRCAARTLIRGLGCGCAGVRVSSEVSRSRSTFARGYRVTDRRFVPWAPGKKRAATAATAAATEGRPVGWPARGPAHS
jgi:hypothetical protein